MNRIEYINQRLAKPHFRENDYQIISSLIHALTSDEACQYFDFTFEQDYRARRYVLKKISNDISKAYTPAHKKLIGTLIKKLDKKGFGRKDSCSYCLDYFVDSLPARSRRKILELFLGSKSSRNRDRALKRLNLKWDKTYFELIEQVWHLYHDNYCLSIILNHFPGKFLLDNYKTILKYTKPYQTSKLFLKLGAIDFELVKELKDIDGISYCYVLAKFGQKISIVEAKEILKDNYKDERIGLLLWSFGQMSLWDNIVEYDNCYREKHHQSTLEKYINN